LVPVIGLVQVGSQSMADRYTYVPLVGIFLLLSWSVPNHVLARRTWQTAFALASVAIIVVCALVARIQVGYWKDEETLFRHALAVTHDNWAAHNNLAVALEYQGRIDEALGHFEQAVEIAPTFADGQEHLGEILARLNRVTEAIEHYELALRVRPDFAEAHCNLGVALAALGRTTEAITQFEQAVRYKPNYAEAFNNLGAVWWRIGKVTEAVNCYEQALRLNPDNAEAHYNLGGALEQSGRIPDAVAHYEEALRLRPNFPQARDRLARLQRAQ